MASRAEPLSLPQRCDLAGQRVSRRGLTWSHLDDDISLSYADVPVVACCLVSGLTDSVAFSAASVFVSMQTGKLSRASRQRGIRD